MKAKQIYKTDSYLKLQEVKLHLQRLLIGHHPEVHVGLATHDSTLDRLCLCLHEHGLGVLLLLMKVRETAFQNRGGHRLLNRDSARHKVGNKINVIYESGILGMHRGGTTGELSTNGSSIGSIHLDLTRIGRRTDTASSKTRKKGGAMIGHSALEKTGRM